MDLKIHRRLKKLLLNVAFLLRTGAPFYVVTRYLAGSFANLFSKKYKTEVISFRKYTQSKKFSRDYFRNNIPVWLNTFEKYHFKDKPRLDILEVGSFEGMSALFLLSRFDNSFITCVDTWQGSDEHNGGEYVASIEDRFDNNLSKFSKRVSKFSGTSFSFFQKNAQQKLYDLVYIDGSHYVDDVIIDAIKGFEVLKDGGIMIVDDYLWKYYERAMDNPCSAINAFLKLKTGRYKLIHVGNQLLLEKKMDKN